MKKGEFVYTPRFCSVKIQKVCRNNKTARKQGFTEPTHYESSKYDILGKHTGLNHMIFAAVTK
jgi:hypothetical protein